MGFLSLVATTAMAGLGGYLAARFRFRIERGAMRALAASVLAWAWMTVGLQLLGTVGALDRTWILVVAALGLAAGIAARISRGALPDPPWPRGEYWGIAGAAAYAFLSYAVVRFASMSLLLPPKVVSDGPIYHLFFAARWWKAGRISLVASPFGENAATYFPANGDLVFAGLMALYEGDRPARIGQAPFFLIAGLAAYAIARRLGAGAASAIVATCFFLSCTPLLLFAFEANVDTFFIAGYLAAVAFGIRYALDGGHLCSLIFAGLSAGLAWGSKPTAILFVPPLLLLTAAVAVRKHGFRRGAPGRLAVLAAATLLTCGFWLARGLILTGNPLYPMHLEAFDRVILAGWYPQAAMQRSQFYLPRGDWRAFLAITAMVFDGRLLPLWAAALLGLWAIRRPRAPADWAVWAVSALSVANVATYWLLIPYRTQQRFMLQAVGLAAAPLARLLDRFPPLRWAAVALLALHLATPGSWPFGGPDPHDPSRVNPAFWELSDIIPKAASPPVRLPPPPGQWPVFFAAPGGLEFLAIEMFLVLGPIAAAFLAARAFRTGRPVATTWAVAGSVILAAIVTVGTDYNAGFSARIHPTFGDYQKGWAALENLSPRGGTRVAYAGTNLPYYLMAGGLRNHVEYVNIDERRDWLMHEYQRTAVDRGDPPLADTPGPRHEAVHPEYDLRVARRIARGVKPSALWDTPRPGWDRLHPNYDAWLANLRASNIRLLVVAKANPMDGLFNIADAQEFPIERVWADTHPEDFELAYPRQGQDLKMRIYRVREK